MIEALYTPAGMLYVALAILVMLFPFAIMGLKYISMRSRMKKAQKKGHVLIEMESEGGVVRRFTVKPEGESFTWEEKTYTLPLSARKYDIESGLYMWRFKEDDAVPIDTSPKDPLLNPKATFEVIKLMSMVYGGLEIKKYMKMILIAIAAVGGLVLLLATGGVH